MGKFLNKIIKSSLYLLVFLLPVWFLPFSFEGYEFNKQYLLFFLVSLGFLAWLAKMVLCDKEIKFRRTPLDIPILIFLFISILSVAFSIDKSSSLFGFYGRFSDNLIGILSLGALYFLITNNVSLGENRGERVSPSLSGMLKTLLWSAFFVLLFSYFSLFGVWQIMATKFQGIASNLPMLMSRIFNPIGGSLESLAIFLSVVAVLLVALILKFQNHNSKVKNFCLFFLLLASTILLIIIDFTAAWLALALSLILFLVFAFWSRVFKERVNVLLIPIILIIISIALLFTQVSNFKLQVKNYNILDSPKEILLDQKTTWQVAWGAIKNYPVLGSGIGTFSQDFAKFKPKEFNQTNLWQLRFDKGSSQVAETISTVGILGFLSWLAIAGLFFLISFYLLRKIKGGESGPGGLQLPFFFGFLSLVLSQIFYYQNTTLAFLFWLFLGLGVISWAAPLKEKVFSFKNFPEMKLVFTIVLLVLALVIFGSYFFAGRFYLADAKYKEGVISGRAEDLETAVNLSKSRATYAITLSRSYFLEASVELQKSVEEQATQKIQVNFAKSIDEAKRATQISPNWVAAFENLGMIYRDIRGFAEGASNWAIDSFSKAAELEPTNPVFPTEMGKILRDDEKTDEAKNEFEKALELKPDYLDAEIQSALIFEQEGNSQESIAKLKEIVEQNPSSVEAIFQLGRVYYNNNQTDEAIGQFEKAIQIFPNHSNSLYALGIAYQKKGLTGKALEQFEKVLELNPGNQDVLQKIAELKKPEKEEEKK
jgi:putative inorganic carbon (HCO3(-)) transporter